MCKRLILCMAVFLSGIVTNAQNSEEAKRVLRLSREKCMSIQQGHYEVEHWKKFMMDKDTTITRNTCDFRKLPEDTTRYFSPTMIYRRTIM